MRAGVLLIVAMIASCQYSENRYLRRSVRNEEVVGTWRLTAASVKDLREAGHHTHLTPADHQIRLDADGSCSFTSFLNPGLMSSSDSQYVTAPCGWWIDSGGKNQALRIDVGAAQRNAPHLSFSFAEEKGRLLLWQYIADPDAWKYIEFERVKTETPPGGGVSSR